MADEADDDEADHCGLDPVQRISQNYFESFTEVILRHEHTNGGYIRPFTVVGF